MSSTIPTPPQGKRPGYGLFAVAATSYALGVCIFAGWSGVQQRSALVDQVDRSLLQALYATELILDPAALRRAANDNGLHTPEYVQQKRQLDLFAKECGLDMLGVVACGTNGVHVLAASELHGADPGNGASTPLTPLVAEVVNADGPVPIVRFIDDYFSGPVRAAVLYRPVGGGAGYAIIAERNAQPIRALLRRIIVRSLSQGLFLLLMAFPMAMLYNRARQKSARALAELNQRLRVEVAQQKAREAELKDAIGDLERFNALAVGREGRIIGLKAEVNTLLEQMGSKKRYNIDTAATETPNTPPPDAEGL